MARNTSCMFNKKRNKEQKSNNHPSLVSLNNHLSLYTNSCYVHRAETVFNDIEVDCY